MFNKYAFLLLLIGNLAFSQLSVRNDAYVFINDEIVFVEDDINLNEANSSMYLRNEAQVIQGTGVTGNSGVGSLSVYQEGNVDEYEYNYWCSPVGTTTNNSVNNPFGITLLNDVTGLITSTPAGTAQDPNHNGSSSPLNIEPRWIYKTIASDSYYDWVQVLTASTINPGEGFTMKGTAGSGDAQQYDFKGKPNNGTMSVAVETGKESLVGNPYPSALDAFAYIHDLENRTVIDGTLRFWEQNPAINSHLLKAYDGGYASYTIDPTGTIETPVAAVYNTYNGDGSINTGNTGTGSKIPTQYIPIGQGFMVVGSANGVVKAKNSHRVYITEAHADSRFFKSSNTKKKTSKAANSFVQVPNDAKRFRLNVDFNDTYTRQLVETFHNSATDGFDYGLECKMFIQDILHSDAYWLIDEKPYVAEALPFDVALSIPLSIKVTTESQIKIRIADVQNFDNSQPIYVHDTENNTYTDLRTQDFNVTIEANNYPDRFKIVFKEETLNTTEINLDDLTIFHNNSISELKVLNPNAVNIETLSLFDVTGKEVKKESINNSKKAYTYSTKQLRNGVYIAKVILSNNQVLNKKIIIENKK
ncbi:T9SS type A sorting domain-containing protein [Flavivirga eckloniae]|uniref:Secretion protein n=1 Tax=Flavivirga eckloniae TaxID=1803846 RepID=A0A2K9PVP3_9FLAO|nr:T9SS type A sorting domain-containing protein [Flavivirga eckloniae]AUP81140.1 secretion protein [Flavivirga eckloniae]